MNRQQPPALNITVMSAALLVALTACGQDTGPTTEEEQDGANAEGTEESQDDQPSEEAGEEPTTDQQVVPAERQSQEAAGPQPRLGITYDGGVAVVEGSTLDVVDVFDAEGFLRINPAGDGRHMFVSEGGSFRLLDAGTWGEPHGDHNHYYTTDPLLSDITVDGPEPGHVVAHHGTGALFFDGTGEIHTFDLAHLDAEEDLDTDVFHTEDPHHGVAVSFDDGSQFQTLGDDQDRPGARVIDSEGEEIARNEDCPGVHGEAAGPDGVVAVGCEDGALVWDGEEFTKIDAGPDYARTGNLFSAEDSSILLGDYREDEEEPMTEVALVDVAAGELSTAEIGSAYNFRSLARGPEGQALVLAEDGHLHVLDPESGEPTDSIEVIDEWTEPEEWQQPRPAIQVSGDIAYITDPAAQTIQMVDLTEMEIINSAELDFTPNEVTIAEGRPVEGVSDDYDDDHDHDHDEDHDHNDH